jgi:mannose-6-phosphate isomerase
VKPLLLPANTPPQFYRGGRYLAELRGARLPDRYRPEDWVASPVPRFGESSTGLTVLADGRTLVDALAADPDDWLGPAHVAEYGADPALLVKLLDAGERLPVHCHPDRRFARAHLASGYGKTEAWIVIAAGSEACVHLGFRDDLEPDRLAGWVAGQETSALLAATNRLPVAPGDAVLVPAGIPHAIGEGVFIVEVQEPTDYSVLLEWEGFRVDPEAGHLGLGWKLALACVDRSAWSAERLKRLRTARKNQLRPGAWQLFPEDADAFFRAERLRPQPVAELDSSYSVLVVIEGSGRLDLEHGGEMAVRRGDTALIPHAAGRGRLTGAVLAYRCLPPLPAQQVSGSPHAQ